jgi:uncharacterized protein (TIGR04255 family)
VYNVIDTDDLPGFRNPPVQEVAVAVQFSGIQGLKTVHLGAFWQSVRDEFPKFDDLPPFAGMEDRTGPKLELVPLPPLRRVMMSSEDGSLSLQLQESRFITNWVKANDKIEYPRFNAVFEAYERYFEHLAAFVAAEGIGHIEPTHYELTYVNELCPVDDSMMENLESLLGFCKWQHIERQFLGNPTAVNFAWQFPLPNEAGKLLLNINPAKKTDGPEVMLFVLKCVASATATESDGKTWFSAAHKAIVRTFKELTTPIGHDRWGLIRKEPHV